MWKNGTVCKFFSGSDIHTETEQMKMQVQRQIRVIWILPIAGC